VTRAETAAVLTLAATFDRRSVGDADVLAWHDVLADITLEEARDAVKAHYARSREWLMPADVRAFVLDARRHAADARHDTRVRRMLAAPKPLAEVQHAGADRAREAITGGFDPAAAADRRRVRAAACPWCGAHPGELCRNRALGDPLRAIHPSRQAAADPGGVITPPPSPKCDRFVANWRR
jgi:hypothetical protein